MAATLSHRGPDDQGFLEAPLGGGVQLGLAHTRLSIIDIEGGHQPLSNEDGSVQVIFNGEIYNFPELREVLMAKGHQFRTRSDTETIVHAYEQWGDECVSRFRGMFAFIVYDERRQRVLMARDRFGEKPLFLRELGESVLIASEVKALLAFGGPRPTLDHDAIEDYFVYRYVPAPRTLFAGIRKLMPGCYAVWENGRLTEHRYYIPPDHQPLKATHNEDDATQALLDKLDEAVRIRMVSDVPFGAFLSGGIDSSCIVGLMSRHSSLPIKTFSVGFAERSYSELDYARVVAEHFRTEHHELTITQNDIVSKLPALVRFKDSPLSEPSDVPLYLLATEARKSVKMVLTGEGSDEILGGYPKHVVEHWPPLYRALPVKVRSAVIEPLVANLPYRHHRIKTAVASMALDEPTDRLPRWFGALTRNELRELLAPQWFSRTQNADSVQFAVADGVSALRRALFFDQTSWLPDNLLERGDRMTMAASIESRMPFMDHCFAEYVSSLPDTYRVKGRTTKWILRKAAADLLPQTILNRPKVGFRVPVNEWFQTSLREFLCDHLLSPTSITQGYFREGVMRRIVQEHVDGRFNHEKLLWAILNLEIWHKEFGVGR